MLRVITVSCALAVFVPACGGKKTDSATAPNEPATPSPATEQVAPSPQKAPPPAAPPVAHAMLEEYVDLFRPLKEAGEERSALPRLDALVSRVRVEVGNGTVSAEFAARFERLLHVSRLALAPDPGRSHRAEV